MRLPALLTVSILFGTAGAKAADPPAPKTFNSKHYRIVHDTADDEAGALGDHLDLMYECLHTSMATLGDPGPTLRLKAQLFATRPEYVTFLAGLGIDGHSSGGIYLSDGNGDGMLATFLDASSVVAPQRTLQHEATHQYLHLALGLNPPQWLDEGLATYYEDGCLVDGQLWTGLADVEKLDYLKADLAKGLSMDVGWFFRCTTEQWNILMDRDAISGQRLYDRSWALVFYLLHGDGGSHRRQFWEFVRAAAVRPDNCANAFAAVFRVLTPDYWRIRWERWLREIQPDPISATLQRAEHLARALRMLQLKACPPSLDVRDLPDALRRIGYHDCHYRGGHAVEFAADDLQLYTYPGPDGRDHPFVLEPSASPGLPPVVRAPLLNPQPLAWWATSADGAVKLRVTLAKLPAA